MTKLPFSIYDFFGYLSCGFLLLAAVDYTFNDGTLLRQKLDGFSAVVFFWILLIYIIGHIIANVASWLFENGMIRKVLGPSEEAVFRSTRHATGWGRIFPGYYGPLPKEIRERVLAKANERAGITTPGRGLFLHCHSIVKRDQVTLERLSNFINAYGFCRNVSLTAIVSALIVLIPVLSALGHHLAVPRNNLLWAGLGVVVSVGMFYRYLKFFRLYTFEVFVSYAEAEAAKP
jgi:hypothetical protein